MYCADGVLIQGCIKGIVVVLVMVVVVVVEAVTCDEDTDVVAVGAGELVFVFLFLGLPLGLRFLRPAEHVCVAVGSGDCILLLLASSMAIASDIICSASFTPAILSA